MDKSPTTIVDVSSLAAGASTTLADCSLVDLSRTINTFIQVAATFNASATGGLTIKWYASYDGTNFDTTPWLTDTVECDPGNPVQVPLNPINPSPMYLKCTVTNDDSTYAVTNLKVIFTKRDL